MSGKELTVSVSSHGRVKVSLGHSVVGSTCYFNSFINTLSLYIYR